MKFEGLNSDKGLTALNKHLTDFSYVDGYTASQADVVAFKDTGKAPDAKKYQNAARWYKHIASFSDAERKSWPAAGTGVTTSAAAAKTASPAKMASPAKKASPAKTASPSKQKGKKEAKVEEKKDEDDIDLFGDNPDDEEEYERQLQERVKKAQEAKGGKTKKDVIAKSMVIIDVKPWGEETDLAELEQKIRELVIEGLVWGKAEQKPIAYGVKKIQIAAVVEDDKVSVDDVQEKIQEFEDHVQSTDIVSFNKL